jgi:hypothetical protein
MNSTGAGIADVIIANAALKPNDAALHALLNMFGMAFVPEVQDILPVQAIPASPPTLEPGDENDAPTSEMPARSLLAWVRHLRPVRQQRLRKAPQDPLPRVASTLANTTGAFEGLLTVRDGAELVRFAASVHLPTGGIDVQRVVHELASARALTELPRCHLPSLALGAQVLVDVGLSMQPFLADQQQLLRRFERNLRHLSAVRYFADDPHKGCGPERRKASWSRYVLPSAGTPVIALSDLGCGFPRGSAATRAWLQLATRLRHRESRLVVFAPVRLARIPLELRRAVDLVLWDRSAVRRNVMQLAGVCRDQHGIAC